jgi:hypothetical protein
MVGREDFTRKWQDPYIARRLAPDRMLALLAKLEDAGGFSRVGPRSLEQGNDCDGNRA